MTASNPSDRTTGDRSAAASGEQQRIDHPLSPFGYHRPPHWLWRRSRRAFAIYAGAQDMWIILTGKLSLHRAWQAGYDDHARWEAARVMRGGR